MVDRKGSGASAPRNPPDDALFQKAAACQWADITVHIDRDLPALILGVRLDETRGLEVLLSPDAGLDLALKLAGACERLRAEQDQPPPPEYDRRKRLGGGEA